MRRKQRVDGVDAIDGAVQKTLLAERGLHGATNRLPGFVTDPTVNPAIRDDFDVTVGQ